MQFSFPALLAIISTVVTITSGAPTPVNNARGLEAASATFQLETRGSNDKVILQYLRDIDTRTASGSFNNNVWTRIHGDSKSSVDGNLHMETGCMQGVDQVRLIQSGVKGSGAVLVTLQVPGRSKGKIGCAIHQLRVHYGGSIPPGESC